MEIFITDWLNLLVRWVHMVVGIGWIGTSFYFIALDLSLRKRENMNDGVAGTAWEVHGGGFYHVERYLVAPKHVPSDLLWYIWEAYLTWITGFLLLILQYYLNASAYLIDPNVLALEPWQAIAISIVGLAAGWLVYDGVCRSPLGKNTPALAVVVFALILAATWAFTQVFSGRGALIHVGAFVGTIMAVNVFGVIIPGQKKVTASLLAGEEPEARHLQVAKQRSVHNNYLTLPVLLMMVSAHYPMLTGHPHAWILVALIMLMGAMVSHFINRHDAGDPFARFFWTLPVAAVALAAALVMTAPVPRTGSADLDVSDEQALVIALKHCAMCHAQNPTYDGFDEAPKAVKLETIADLRRYATQIMAFAVRSDAMPLGNETEMTREERDRLGAWIADQ